MIKIITRPDNTKCMVVTTKDGDNVTQMVREFDERAQTALDELMRGVIDERQLVSNLEDDEFDPAQVAHEVTRKLRKISDHLSCDGLHVYFDNDTFGQIMLDTTLEDHLVALLRNDADESEWRPWALFCERLYANVHHDIRERLFAWLTSQGWLTVDERGRLVGYRGCQAGPDDVPVSVHQGAAMVNGVRINGHVPNPVGAVVEMRRSSVQHDPTVGCSSGLHVGTLRYARSWAPHDGYILRVAVAPEDIVSVPFECDSEKIRCCRFQVLSAERISTADTEAWRSELTYGACDEDDDECIDSPCIGCPLDDCNCCNYA